MGAPCAYVTATYLLCFSVASRTENRYPLELFSLIRTGPYLALGGTNSIVYPSISPIITLCSDMLLLSFSCVSHILKLRRTLMRFCPKNKPLRCLNIQQIPPHQLHRHPRRKRPLKFAQSVFRQTGHKSVGGFLGLPEPSGRYFFNGVLHSIETDPIAFDAELEVVGPKRGLMIR